MDGPLDQVVNTYGAYKPLFTEFGLYLVMCVTTPEQIELEDAFTRVRYQENFLPVEGYPRWRRQELRRFYETEGRDFIENALGTLDCNTKALTIMLKTLNSYRENYSLFRKLDIRFVKEERIELIGNSNCINGTERQLVDLMTGTPFCVVPIEHTRE